MTDTGEKFEDALKMQAMRLIWSWLRPVLLPVFSAVVVTQLGASVFMQGHVDTAVKTEVIPAARHINTLHKSIRAAYGELAKVTNDHAKSIHGKASVLKVERLEEIILHQRSELVEAFIMLEAIGVVIQSRHGRGTLQRALDNIPVEVAEAATLMPSLSPDEPLVPSKFTAFYEAEGKEDAIQDTHDR